MNKHTNKKINPNTISPNDILDDIYIIYKKVGFINLNIYLEKGNYRRNHIDYHFGSFNKALKQINLRNVSKSKKKEPTNKKDLIENVKEVYEKNKENFTKKLYLQQGKFKEKDINEVFDTFTNMVKELGLLKTKQLNKEEAILKAKELLISEGDLTESLFFKKTGYPIRAFKTVFGSFTDFLKEAEIYEQITELRKKKQIKRGSSTNKYQFKNISKEELTKDVLSLYSKCKENKFTSQYYYNNSQFTRGLVKKHFDTFSKMLEELGLQVNMNKNFTKEDVIQHMIFLYTKHGKLTSVIQREDGKYGQDVIAKYFGSFENMKKELKIDNGYNRNISEEDLLEDLMNIVKKHGEINTNLIDKEGKYSRPTYLHRLGGSMESIARKLNIINSNPNSTISQVGKYCIHLVSTMLDENYELEKTFDWLINDKTKGKLRIDGYFDKYNLAVEYDGKQHYEYTPHFDKDEESFKERQSHDKLKDQLCKENGVKLIRIRYDEPLTKEHLKNKLIEIGILKS